MACAWLRSSRHGAATRERSKNRRSVSVVRYSRVEIHGSARRHGVADEDMLHAVELAVVVDDLGEDPDRWLVLGPDHAGNLLEVVVLISAEGDHLIIHAMPVRPINRRLLEQ